MVPYSYYNNRFLLLMETWADFSEYFCQPLGGGDNTPTHKSSPQEPSSQPRENISMAMGHDYSYTTHKTPEDFIYEGCT